MISHLIAYTELNIAGAFKKEPFDYLTGYQADIHRFYIRANEGLRRAKFGYTITIIFYDFIAASFLIPFAKIQLFSDSHI